MRRQYALRSASKKDSKTLHDLALGGALVVAIIALIVTCVQSSNTEQSLANARSNAATVGANDSAALQQVLLLQSQWVEGHMTGGNESIVQEGTFLWSVGRHQDDDLGEGCSSQVVGGYSIVSAGTGYRVGDLIVYDYDAPTGGGRYSDPFVLSVDAVGLAGQVLQFTMLTPGCFISDPAGNSTYSTLSIPGTGFTVKRWVTVATGGAAIYAWNNHAYYNYDAPQHILLAPVQPANYTLKRVTIGSTAYTVLQLDAPEFPIRIRDGNAIRLRFELYRFTPFVPELLSFYFYGYTFPLTQRNLDAMDLEEYDNTCFRTQNPSVCFLDGALPFYTTPMNLNSVRIYSTYYDSSPDLYDNSVGWTYKSQGSVHNYALNGTVFTLRRPLMLVLPSL